MAAGLILTAHAAWQLGSRPVITAAADRLDDELLYREALDSGIHNDPELRALLVQRMRRTLEPMLPPPSVEELQAFRQQHPERYRLSPAVSFDHISYPKEKQGAVPAGLLDRLNAGEAPEHFGVRSRMPSPQPSVFRPELEKMLGRKAAARIFSEEGTSWFGPVETEHDIFFIRIRTRTPAEDLPFEQIRSVLAEHWKTEQRRRAVRTELDRLKRKYRIVTPPAAGEQP